MVLGEAVEAALDSEVAHRRHQKSLQTEHIGTDAEGANDAVDAEDDLGGICISDGNADTHLFISLDED